MTQRDDASPEGGRRLHHLVPYLVPFTLTCIGSLDMLMLGRSEWGAQHEAARFGAALGLWALAAFGAWRASSVPGAPFRSLYWRTCAFAFLSGALSAAEVSGGFLLLECAVSGIVVTTVAMQAAGVTFMARLPLRAQLSAHGLFWSMFLVMLVRDVDVSLSGATGGFLLTILLLVVSAARSRTGDRG